MTSRRRRWLLCLVLLLGTGTLLCFFRQLWLPLPARFLDVSEAPQRVDCVFVLSGEPGTRPFVAAALVKAGLARQVLLARSVLTPEALDGILLPEHEISRRVLLARGVPAEAIVVLAGEINSTPDEARLLGEFLDGRPDCTVAVVTNAFHTRRARWIFCRVLGERISHVHFVAAPQDDFDASDWWQSERGTVLYLSELVKLPFEWAR